MSKQGDVIEVPGALNGTSITEEQIDDPLDRIFDSALFAKGLSYALRNMCEQLPDDLGFGETSIAQAIEDNLHT
ncbi:MAG: hypothetical protein AAFY56_20940 [Pseudomonadota bacterium]